MPALSETGAAHDNGINDMRALAASPGFQSFLLDLLERLLAREASDDADPEPTRSDALGKQLCKRLNTWLKQGGSSGEQCRQLPQEAQHGLRKAVKRLAYSLEFS